MHWHQLNRPEKRMITVVSGQENMSMEEIEKVIKARQDGDPNQWVIQIFCQKPDVRMLLDRLLRQ